MGTAVQELIFRIGFDPAVATREMRAFTSNVEASLRQVGVTEKQQAAVSVSVQRQTEAAKLRAFQQSINQIAREEQRRVSEAVKSANQRLREEQRAAREVARINAETARQAIQQERLRERIAKQTADAQIREAKRAARELEQTLAASRGGGGPGGVGNLLAISGALGRVPGLSGLSSELSAVTAASTEAGAATAGLAGPIGLAVAAFAAEVAVIAGVTKGLINLARETAAFQGALFDMSQQVGVSVETLSALEVLASTTGGNIETVAASLAIFQRNLEASHDPTSKEAQLLRNLGVTSTETEEALRQTLAALFAMGEGTAQTNAVLELFGRSGRFVNAILKESQGNLDEAIRRFRELGIVVSTEDAKAADELNDALTTLDFQIRGLKALVGQEVLPFLLTTLKDLQSTLKDNREAVEAVGVAVRVTTALIAQPFRGALIALNTLLLTHKGELILIRDLYEQIAAAIQLVTNSVPKVDVNAIPEQPLGRVDGLKLLQEAQKAFLAGLKPLDLREFFGTKEKARAAADPGIALLRQLQSELRRLEGETKAQEVAERLLDEQFKNTNTSLREQIRIAANLIDIKRAQADVDRIIKEESERRQQAIIQERDAVNDFIFAQEIALKGANTELDRANRFIAQILTSSGNISGILDEATQRLIRFNALAADSAERIKRMLDLMRETADAVPSPNEGRTVSTELPKVVFDDSFLGPPPVLPDAELLEHQIDAALRAQDAFAGLGVVMSDALNLGNAGAIAFGESVGAVFAGVAEAAGEVVRSFVLLGSTGGNFRKLAAEIIASIAQQATVKAVFELAEGLAMLALTWFTGNPKYAESAGAHFAAAAAYGVVAGVAAVAGRAVAGDTFKQKPSSSGTSTTNNDRGQSGELNPITLGRNQALPPNAHTQIIRHEHVFRIQSNDSHIVDVISKDFRQGGTTRELVLADGDF